MNKHLKITFAAVALLLSAFMASRAYLYHRAIKLLDETRNMDRATDPTADALAFLRAYRSYYTGKTCDREVCQYRFLLTNRVLSFFGLAKRSEIEVLLTFDRERLSDIEVNFTSYLSTEISPVVHLQEDFCNAREGCGYFFIDPHGRDLSNTWNGSIQFGQFAKEEQRKAAWTVNIGCFTAINGCHDLSEISPAVWKRTNANRISSRM